MTESAPAPVKPTPTFWQRLWRELLEPIVFAVLVTQFIGTLVGVDGTSMMPSLRNHERVLVPKWEPWLHKIGVGNFHRGDIIIFKPPTEYATARPEQGLRPFLNLWTYRPFLIKRLIGLPGDKISITAGKVSVNGTPLNQSFTTDYWQAQGCWDTSSGLANNIQSSEQGYLKDQPTITVPAGHYFVMGDNRTASGSEDSRLFGPVALKDIAGRAAAVIWPIVRQRNAKFDCSSGDPGPNSFTYSGPTQLNLRWIFRPPGFSQIPAASK